MGRTPSLRHSGWGSVSPSSTGAHGAGGLTVRLSFSGHVRQADDGSLPRVGVVDEHCWQEEPNVSDEESEKGRG